MNAKIKVRSSQVAKTQEKTATVKKTPKTKNPSQKPKDKSFFAVLGYIKNIYETCHNIWNSFLALGCNRLVTQTIYAKRK